MIYLLQSKDGVTAGANTLAEAKTRSGTFSISGYGFGKGSTIARQAPRISPDIIFIHFALAQDCGLGHGRCYACGAGVRGVADGYRSKKSSAWTDRAFG